MSKTVLITWTLAVGVCHINHSADISCFSCKSKTSKICFLPLQIEAEVGQGLGGVFAGAGRGARQPDLLRAPDRARQLRHPRAHLHPPQLPRRTGSVPTKQDQEQKSGAGASRIRSRSFYRISGAPEVTFIGSFCLKRSSCSIPIFCSVEAPVKIDMRQQKHL